MSREPEQRVTLQGLADRLGISATTVSRVLNGRARQYRISRETEEAVLALAAQLHYSPNQLARGLRMRRSMTVGLVIPDISNPFFAGTARSVEMEAGKRGYAIVLCDTREDTAVEIRSLQILEDRDVDGLVVFPVGQSGEHLRRYENGRLPVVVADRCFPDLRLPYVVSDNCGGARQAVDYLASRGHRTIACVGGMPGTLPGKERIRGYRDAMEHNNLRIDDSLVVGNGFSEESGYESMAALIGKRPDVTAVWAAGSLVAMGILRALAEADLAVPDDVSVVCFDDPAWADFLRTPLTAVAQDNAAMGRAAVALLLDGPGAGRDAAPERVVLSVTLIERDSVAAPRTGSRERIPGGA